MTELPRSVSYKADLDSTLRLYRASLARCVLPSALLILVGAGLTAVMGRRLVETDDLMQEIAQIEALLSSAFLWCWVAGAIALAVPLYAAMVANCHALAVGARAPPALGLGIALQTLPSALTAAAVFLVLTSLGSMLLLVPGAYLWGMWQLWLVPLVIERSGPVAALRRSWQLVAGAWWRITGLITLVTMIAMAPALMCPLLFAGTLAPASMTVAVGVLILLLVPLVPAVLVVVYLERNGAPRAGVT